MILFSGSNWIVDWLNYSASNLHLFQQERWASVSFFLPFCIFFLSFFCPTKTRFLDHLQNIQFKRFGGGTCSFLNRIQAQVQASKTQKGKMNGIGKVISFLTLQREWHDSFSKFPQKRGAQNRWVAKKETDCQALRVFFMLQKKRLFALIADFFRVANEKVPFNCTFFI